MEHLFTVVDRMKQDYTHSGKMDLGKAASASGMKDFGTPEDISRIQQAADWDRTQVRLFGEFLYIRSLHNEGKANKCVADVNALIKKYNLKLKPIAITELDQATHFSPQVLANLIILTGVQAQNDLARPSTDIKTDTHVLCFLVDNRADLEFYKERIAGDPTPALCHRLGPLFTTLFPPDGEPIHLGRLSDVAGISDSGDKKIIYLKGRRTYALKLQNGEDVSLAEPRAAAELFSAYCSEQVRVNSTPTMRLFSVNHYGTTTEVQIGDSMFSLTEAELRRLQSGQQLPNDHPLHRAVVNAASGEASLVMYTHPLMVKAGPPQKFADDFAFTLQQAYPEYRIYRDP